MGVIILIKNNKKVEWKYIGYIFIGIIIILFLVYLVNVMIRTEAIFEVAQDNDWISFWGSVLGSSIGGIITFIVLRVTIKNENEKREDEKRMSVLPYLDYNLVCDEYIEKKLKTKHMSQSMSHGLHNSSEYNYTVKLKLAIENIGINKAIKPIVRQKKNNNQRDYEEFYRRYVDVGDNMLIYISIELDIRKVEEYFMELNVTYYNLRRDLYSQDITIKCEPMNIRSENNLRIASGFHPNIVNISEPVLINL